MPTESTSTHQASLARVLKLEVPLVVLMGERSMPTSDVLALAPGSIIELNRDADAELSVLVNNRAIGSGHAVKVGENFGIRLSFVGDLTSRVEAMGPQDSAAA